MMSNKKHFDNFKVIIFVLNILQSCMISPVFKRSFPSRCVKFLHVCYDIFLIKIRFFNL